MKSLGQLEPNLVEIVIGWYSKTLFDPKSTKAITKKLKEINCYTTK
jgi:hypothetical protein